MLCVNYSSFLACPPIKKEAVCRRGFKPPSFRTTVVTGWECETGHRSKCKEKISNPLGDGEGCRQ